MDNSNLWAYFQNPTPDGPNNTMAIEDNVLPEEVSFSLSGGMYQGNQMLELFVVTGEGIIRYTMDGSWPTGASPAYTNPISITATSVVRARLYLTGKLPGPVITRTYLLNDSSTLPVVSIVTDSEHFFSDETGLYVEGTNGILGYCSDDPVNWNQDWERPANIEYFTREGIPVINQMVGIKINGGCSRLWDYKSLAVIARHKYGDNSLSYQFFKSKEVDSFKSLVLRNSGSDAYYSMLRDGFMQSLLEGQMDLDLQGYQPANIFINGIYWGILNVREKINEHYPASNYDLDSDQIDMLEREHYALYERTINGSGEHYEALINYVGDNDLSEEVHYEYVKTQMDVNEYMNYFLTEIYFKNEDWPRNNIKYWRPHVDGGKWRWVMYDTDAGWGLVTRTDNSLEAALNAGRPSTLITALLENDDFQNEFIQRMAGFINTTFHPENVGHIFDSIRGQLDPEIYRHIDKYDRPKAVIYEKQVEEVIPDFTVERPAIVRAHMMDEFGISGMYNLSVTVNDTEKGYINASGVTLPHGSSNYFFNDVPLRLEAIPANGYAFSHWEGESDSESKSISLNVSDDIALKAVFLPASPVNNIYINELCASNETNQKDEYLEYDDWIEIYNGNDFDVDLAGLYLSDSAAMPTKYMIPSGHPDLTTVAAGDYLIIWCDNEPLQGPLHTNFKLKKEGEVLSLVQQIDQDFQYVAIVHYPALQTDMTYGKVPVSGNWEYMAPTPLAINEQGDFKELLINEFLTKNCGAVSDEFMEMDDWIEIYNPGPDTIDLGGLYVTDSLEVPLKHFIPAGGEDTRIPPNGFKVLWADNQPEQGALHLGFRLNGKKEQIGLYQLGMGFVDSLSYSLNNSGIAMGRYVGSDLIQPVTATPGEPNITINIENIFINEFMASNRSTGSDQSGEYDDWIEIYNQNDFPVDLGGLYITDSLKHPNKFQIPTCQSELTTIPAGGFIILWADGQEEQGTLHLDFKLRGDGEEIGLVQLDGMTFIDSISYKQVLPDMALGRLEDGASNIQVVSATPGFSNYVVTTGKLYLSELSASGNTSHPDPSGEFDDWIEVYNDNDFEVDIGGLYITDDLDKLSKFRISPTNPELTTIGAKDYLILWADDQPEQGITHLGFKLGGSGEQLALVDIDRVSIIDSVSFPIQYSNFTYGRILNTGNWTFLRPTHSNLNIHTPVSGVFINEFMASNKSFPNDDGEFEDWIEIYNSNNFPVDIGGLFLTDTIGDPTKFRIPGNSPELTTLDPHDYFVFIADNDKDQGWNHTNFKLSSEGESILLYYSDETTLLDSITFSKQFKNSAFGRITNTGSWHTIPPTPGKQNIIPDYSQLVINEVMGYNKTKYSDEYTEYDDWIELYNAGDTPIDIGGLYLTDSIDNPNLSRISSEHPDSTTIPAGEYLILWADNSEDQGILHLGFKIEKTGETIAIFDHSNVMVDSIRYPFISPNLSWGRLTDGNDIYTIFSKPSPLSPNLHTSSHAAELIANALSIYPNPVSDRAVINLFLDEPSELTVEIIDSKGTLCALLKEYHYGIGQQSFNWNVRDASGNHLESGLYLCRVRTSKEIFVVKLLFQDF